MKILYIIKNEKNMTDSFKEIMEAESQEGIYIKVVKLYENDPDCGSIIDDIFDFDKVVTL